MEEARMEPRERNNEQQRRMPDQGGDGSSEDGELDAIRADGNSFLAAGDEAIRRALSGNSEAFLRANRQRGGQ